MESVMMDSMYSIPSDNKTIKCIITKDAVLGNEKPKVILSEENITRKPITKRSTKKSKDEIA
jgi:ATP-dependent Clp protease ATP-binding subunit ClpX